MRQFVAQAARLRHRPTNVPNFTPASQPMIPMADHSTVPSDVLVWKQDWKYVHPNDQTIFGFSLDTAGDVDGDGYGDFIVGGPAKGGSAFVFHGTANGPEDAPTWIQGKIDGQDKGEYGYSLGTAGDVNGDGYDDVVVGAPGYRLPDDPQTGGGNDQQDPPQRGAFYIYHGSSNGLSDTPSREYIGQEQAAQLGFSVASAGDFNHDGYDDVVVGLPGSGGNFGLVRIYTGGPNGLSQAPTWEISPPDHAAQFGYSVASAGDVNGDGFSDIIVGSPAYSHGEQLEGAVFLYLGHAGGPADQPDWMAESNSETAWLGFCISGAGDINGDGYSDIVVGAANYTDDQESEGAVFVYMSNGTVFGDTADWKVEGNRKKAQLGFDVSGGGDVNGDGYDDVLIADAHFGLVSYGGELYLGSENGLAKDYAWQAIAEGNSTIGITAHLIGDVNGDGFTDMLLGAPDTFSVYGYLGAGCFDADWDGYTAHNDVTCPQGNDCHDIHDMNNPAYPGAPEICDGLDNNCDGTFDEGCDDDGDGYCDADIDAWMPDGPPPVCPNGAGDCDDTDPDHNPGSPELCNFKDDDCNGQIDEEPKVCGDAQICVQGGCFDPCQSDADCSDGKKCYDGRCAADPCENIQCPDSREECVKGTCQVTCTIEAQCRWDDKQCIDGRCAKNPCDGVVCPTSEVCSDGDCVPPGQSGADAGGDAGDADAGHTGHTNSNSGSSGGCSTTPDGVPTEGGLLVAMMLGGLAWVRRRD